MQQSTTTKLREEGYQELQNTPQILNPSEGSFNSTSLQTYINVNSPVDNSMPSFHVGCGYNSEQSDASMSGRIFVLSFMGKPLTPCKPQKARKLLFGGVAKVVWNKFGEFGIQMSIPTREETPKTCLGIDNGTKFEGISLIVGKENQLNIMWILPDKKKLVRKLTERRILRRARRNRNCRRREARFDNRSKNNFIAPSQLMMVQSRLKYITEFFKYYPISKVAIEDVKFNHRDKKWGKNFSTIEVGKNMIKAFIVGKIGEDNYITFDGRETQKMRKNLGLKKGSNKSAEHFNSHCVDSFTIASEISHAEPNFNIKVIDDSYRYVRRRLHDTQFSKGGVRDKYSTGNFKGIRKGTICEFGQIVGGTGNQLKILPFEEKEDKEKRISSSIKKISWLSHNFKLKEVAIPLPNKLSSPLAN